MKEPSDFCLAGIVALVPVVVTVGLLKGLLGTVLVDYSPYYSDEIHFWHAILSFSRVGFDGGYYVINEAPAPALFSHFGPHGPLFPIVYGTLAHIVGWQLYSGPLLNLALVTLALCLFIALTQPDRRCLMTMGAFLLTCWPLLLLLPTTMQESLHQAIGIILAGFFYQLGYGWEHVRPVSRLWLVTFALIVCASLLRFTWSILFLPLFLLRDAGLSGRATARAFALAIGMAGFVYLAFGYLAAPVQDSVVSQVLLARSWPESAGVVFRNTANNLGAVLLLRGRPLEVLLFYQALFLVLLATTHWVVDWFLSPPPRLHRRLKPVTLLLLFNLGVPLVFTLVFYNIFAWRGFRTLAPHVILSVLLLIRFSRSRGIWPIILTNMLLVFSFGEVYKEFRMPQFDQANRAALVSLQTQLAEFLVYRKDANPWCNTLLVDHGNYPPEIPEIAGVPAGIGLSIVADWSQVSMPLQSRYILLDQGRGEQMRSTTHLELLTHTRLGDLWLNVDSPCR